MNELIKESQNAAVKYLSHISMDCVLFSFRNQRIEVLLLKSKHLQQYLLPGGFVQKEEDLELAAHRALKERSGADKVFLQLFDIFGDAARNREHSHHLPDDLWIRKRFISIGYYALVDHQKVNPIPDHLSESCDWYPLENLPEMGLDHAHIIHTATAALQRHLNYKPIGLNLLPEEFTIPELQKLYEAVLGKKLHRANFSRKMLSFDILCKLDSPRLGLAGKAPHLYRFDLEKYNLALKDGLQKLW